MRWLRRQGSRHGSRAGRWRGWLPGWRFWALSLLGLVAYVTFLLASLPASLAWEAAQRYVPIPPQVEVGSLSGTIWKGRALAVGSSRLQAEQVSWRVRPAALLKGAVVIELKGSIADGFAEGSLQLTRNRVSITVLNGRFPAFPWSSVAEQLTGQAVTLDGSFTFAIDLLELDYAGKISRADGRLAWHEAAITVDRHAELGGITTTLTAADGWLSGDLGDTGGALNLAGEWRLNPLDGKYEVNAVVDTRENAAEILTRSLEMFGPRQEDGIHLGFEGTY